MPEISTANAPVSRSYRYYLLILFATIMAFNFADRLSLGIALQNIKADLSLSDTQLGLVTGLAFSTFYAILGVPIARWADRGNRIDILCLATLMWSAMVALTGTVGGFIQLLAVRVGVGIGDAGTSPTANSLIPDYFSRAERPRAAAIFSLYAPATIILGYWVSGWLNQHLGWREMFIAISLPGLALAALAKFTLREPRVGVELGPLTATAPTAEPPRMRDVLVTLRAKATFRHLLFCYAIMAFYGAGTMQWLPAFFIRSFGVGTAALGSWLTLVTAPLTLVTVYAGGALASRYAGRNERVQFQVIAVTCLVIGADHVLTYLSPNRYAALLFVGLGTVTYMINGPLLAAFQTLLPPQMRATGLAIVYLFTGLIGTGLGPLAAGALSDVLEPAVGRQSLRYALLTLTPLCLWGAWHMWLASRTVSADLLAEPLTRHLPARPKFTRSQS